MELTCWFEGDYLGYLIMSNPLTSQNVFKVRVCFIVSGFECGPRRHKHRRTEGQAEGGTPK
jgi:hypothetical protein